MSKHEIPLFPEDVVAGIDVNAEIELPTMRVRPGAHEQVTGTWRLSPEAAAQLGRQLLAAAGEAPAIVPPGGVLVLANVPLRAAHELARSGSGSDLGIRILCLSEGMTVAAITPGPIDEDPDPERAQYERWVQELSAIATDDESLDDALDRVLATASGPGEDEDDD